MAKRVKVDGRIFEVPDDATPDEIDQISRGGNTSSVAPQPAPAPASAASSAWENLKQGITGPQGLGQFLVGAGKGAVSTAANLAGLVDSGVRHIAPNLPQPTSVNAAKVWAQPTPGTAQSAGRTAEQVGEFFVPGPGEEAAAAKLAAYAPAAAKAIRVGVKAIGAGAVNKAQGGSFTAGAAGGAVGEGVAQAAKAIAPEMGQVALRLRGKDKGFGADAGNFILNRTTGITPSTVARSAQDSINKLAGEKQALLAQAPDVTLQQTRDVATDYLNKADLQGHQETYNGVKALTNQVAQTPSGQVIPVTVPAARAGQLQRGIGEATKWDPAKNSDTLTQAGRAMYGQLGDTLEAAAPDIAPINAEIHSGLPVVERAKAASMAAGLLDRMQHRVAAHTGAALSAAAGFHYGGVPGAIAGLALPEMAVSPTTWLAGARIANSNLFNRGIVPGTVAGALQFNRPGAQ